MMPICVTQLLLYVLQQAMAAGYAAARSGRQNGSHQQDGMSVGLLTACNMSSLLKWKGDLKPRELDSVAAAVTPGCLPKSAS
jgi:hypothetical protein